MRYVLAAVLVLVLIALLCASAQPSLAQDPVVDAWATINADNVHKRQTAEAAAQENASKAADAAATAVVERANTASTVQIMNAQNTASARQATGTAIQRVTGTAIAAGQATGTAQAAGTQVAGTATQVAATETAAPVRTAEALAFSATAQAQASENLQRNIRVGAWGLGIVILMGTGAGILVLLWRYVMSIRFARAKPVVIEVARSSDESSHAPLVSDDDATADAEGANVTGDSHFASVVIENILDQMR